VSAAGQTEPGQEAKQDASRFQPAPPGAHRPGREKDENSAKDSAKAPKPAVIDRENLEGIWKLTSAKWQSRANKERVSGVGGREEPPSPPCLGVALLVSHGSATSPR